MITAETARGLRLRFYEDSLIEVNKYLLTAIENKIEQAAIRGLGEVQVDVEDIPAPVTMILKARGFKIDWWEPCRPRIYWDFIDGGEE